MFHRTLIPRSLRRLAFCCLAYSLLLATCLAQKTSPSEGPANPQPPQIETIDAHDEYIYLIDFSVDGKTMVSAAGDNRAVLWDWPNRKKLHSLPHDAAVYAALIRRDMKQIATSSGEGQVAIWDATNGSKIKEVTDHKNAVHCLAYSADGKHLASIGGDGRMGDTDCRIWDSRDLTLIKKLAGHQRPAYWVGFSPNMKTLVTSGGDQRINVWKTPNWESEKDTKDTILQQRRSIIAHDSDVYRCDISNDGRWLATTGQDKKVKIWDLKSIVQSTAETIKPGFDEQDSAKANDVQPVHTLGESKDPYYAAKFSRDGEFLTTVGDDGSLRIWDTDGFQLSGTVKLSDAALYAVAFTPDSQHVVAGGTDGRLFVVKVADLKKQTQQ